MNLIITLFQGFSWEVCSWPMTRKKLCCFTFHVSFQWACDDLAMLTTRAPHVIEPFSARLSQDGLAECDQLGKKNPEILCHSLARIEPRPRRGQPLRCTHSMTMYPVLSKPGTPCFWNNVPPTPSSKLCTQYLRYCVLSSEIWQKIETTATMF